MTKTQTHTRRFATSREPNLTLSALIANGVFPLQLRAVAVAPSGHVPDAQALGTVLANLAYYGFAPSSDALGALREMDAAHLAQLWQEVEPSFARLTGADRKMDRFVVYKNFPAEVLAMDVAQYWIAQILMYLGAPNDWFTEPEQARPALNEELTLKVLQPEADDSVDRVRSALAQSKARWTDDQQTYALHLGPTGDVLDLASFGFKENGLRLIAARLAQNPNVVVADATDVLRLAATLSGAEPSLREAFRFRAFKRSERRFLVGLLEGAKHLDDDLGARPALWKQLLSRLHPGDFNAPKVSAAYDHLYRGALATYNGRVEAGLAASDVSVLALLASRPGDFVRRLHKAYAVFGAKAVSAFCPLTEKLDNSQLLKLRGYLSTINGRLMLVHPPRGNWTKAQFVMNEKTRISDEHLAELTGAIDRTLAMRLAAALPQGVALDDAAVDVKLQTNDQELAPYGRGTVFHIPEGMTFLRTASYWAHRGGANSWFDNGVNFFDERWQPAGTCCWNATHQMGDAAVFSGDPTNSKDLKGRACQMIDLYLDRLAKRGVRYAVWSVLCYSSVKFSEADEVLATLQWGQSAQSGSTYEPARAQMVFPLKGDNLTKYVAYVDVRDRKLVYMDANLAGEVSSAASNAKRLSESMPAFVEYLNSLPSVADLFMNAPQGSIPVRYSDAQEPVQAEKAWVFKPQNADSRFEALDLAKLL